MDGDLYYQAADIVKKVQDRKGTVKTLVYASGFKNVRQLFALVTECIKNFALLDEIGSECSVNFHKEPALKGSKEVTVVLLYEYLLGRKFGRAVGFRKLLHQYRVSVKASVEKVLSKHGVSNLKEACKTCGQTSIPKIPRYMRINLIKSTVESAIKDLELEGWQFVGKFDKEEFSTKALKLDQQQFGLDPILPDLLVFAPGTDLHDHSLTLSGALVQQDRASCIPALALRPSPGSTVLDCCAAPGNKTSHLASLLKDDGRVIALDRDVKRLGTMTRLLGKSGATCVELIHQDFLTVEPDSEDAADIQYILVDPSCSGSGMLNHQTNEASKSLDENRIQTLKRFQISILKHALRFPNTERVVYSTCSVHQEENEEVAEEVMSQVGDQFRFTKIFPEWRDSRGLKGFPHADYFLRLTPEQDLTQGFFVACFERLKKLKEVEAEETQTGISSKDLKKKKKKKYGNQQDDSGVTSTILNSAEDFQEVELENGDIKKKRKKKQNSSEVKTEEELPLEIHQEGTDGPSPQHPAKKKKRKKSCQEDSNNSLNGEANQDILEETKKKKKKKSFSKRNLDL